MFERRLDRYVEAGLSFDLARLTSTKERKEAWRSSNDGSSLPTAKFLDLFLGKLSFLIWRCLLPLILTMYYYLQCSYF